MRSYDCALETFVKFLKNDIIRKNEHHTIPGGTAVDARIGSFQTSVILGYISIPPDCNSRELGESCSTKTTTKKPFLISTYLMFDHLCIPEKYL